MVGCDGGGAPAGGRGGVQRNCVDDTAECPISAGIEKRGGCIRAIVPGFSLGWDDVLMTVSPTSYPGFLTHEDVLYASG